MGWRGAVAAAGVIFLWGCGNSRASSGGPAPRTTETLADAGTISDTTLDAGTNGPPEAPPTTAAAPDGGTSSAIRDGGLTHVPAPVPADAGTAATAEPDAGSRSPPELVQLTPEQLQQLPPDQTPYCLLGEGRYARYVLEAYRTDFSGIHTCWVAWIGDTGGSLVFNEGAAWDEAKIFVKSAGDVKVPMWKSLGDGLGPVGPEATLDSFSLLVDPDSRFPMVAWVMEESVHWSGSDLFVSRWDGQRWEPTSFDGATRLNAASRAPDPFMGGSTADQPRLGFDSGGYIVLTWRERDQDGKTATYHRVWNADVGGWTAAIPGP